MEPLTAPELAILNKARLVCDVCDALEANDSFVIDDQKLLVCKKCSQDLKDTVITPIRQGLPLNSTTKITPLNFSGGVWSEDNRKILSSLLTPTPHQPKESKTALRRKYIREHCVHFRGTNEYTVLVSCAKRGKVEEEDCDYTPGAPWSCKSFEKEQRG